MSTELSVVDICDEVVSFAHKQGHTKASKNTINWKDLKTEAGSAKFITTSKTIQTKLFQTQNETETVFKHLSLSAMNQKTGQPSTVTNTNEEGGVNASSDVEATSHELERQHNCLLNKGCSRIVCCISVDSTLPNKAEAFVQFTNTIACSRENRLKKNKKLNIQHKARSRDKVKDNFLTKASLSPKFSIKLSPETTGRRKVQFPAKKMHQNIANLAIATEIQVDITEHREEEKGTFEVAYYLWGSVEIIVWGKPYNLVITDVLDTKHNSLFVRESLKPRGSKETVTASKITLRGLYESVQEYYEVKITTISSLSQSLTEVTCFRSDKRSLPKLKPYEVQPLNNQNLARLLYRWLSALNSSQKQRSDNVKQMWMLLLNHKSSFITKMTQRANIEQLCKNLCAMDKLAFTLLLWKTGCDTIDELKTRNNEASLDLNQATINLVNELYAIGVPLSTMKFLWTKEKLCATMQNGDGLQQHMEEKKIELKSFRKSAQQKLLTPLPDRVLVRLLQRWPVQDGWVTAALYLGIDLLNIVSLTCNDCAITTMEEKRMTVLKLWRMKHRRYQKDHIGKAECTTWDLCKELHGMGLPTAVYGFVWEDAETTP